MSDRKRLTFLQTLAMVASILLLLLAVGVADRAAKPLPCFSSPYVSRFYIENGRGLVDVSPCQVQSLWQAPGPIANEQLVQMGEELRPLKRWVHDFGDFVMPVKLSVNLNHLTNATRSTVVLGRDGFKVRGPLLRAFLEAWLLQHNSLLMERPALEREVIVDQMYHYLNGEFDLANALAEGRTATYSPHHWMAELHSWSSLCHSAWYSAWVEDLCERHQSSAKPTLEFAPASLRNLVGSLFWQTYDNLPVAVKAHYFTHWLRAQTHPLEEDTEFELEPMFDYRGVARSSKILSNAIRLTEKLGLMSDDTSNRYWRQSLNQVLNRYENRQGAIDLYIRTNEVDFQLAEVEDLVDAAYENPERLAVVSHHHLHYILPRREPVELIIDSRDLFHRCVWQSRHFDLQELQEQCGQTKAMLIVKKNTLSSTIRYTSLFLSGVESFAHFNPEISLIEINPRALTLASRLANSEIRRVRWLRPNTRQSSPQRVESLVGLLQPQWSEFGRVFQVRGAVDAINWFRGPNPQARPHLE